MAKIYIDAGHGGKDPGAIGIGGAREADINLKVAKYLKKELERNGQTIKMCRTTDATKELAERTNEANKWGADIYCSIHCNAWKEESANGTETYVYKRGYKAEQIADKIHAQLMLALSTRNRCLETVNGKKVNVIKEANFYVLRKTTMPAFLVELAFITNKADCAKLVDASYQKKCAIAVCKGICTYLGITYKGEEKVVKKNDYTGHWAEAAIQEMVDKKIMVGDGKGTFRPDDTITRAEIAQMASNLLKHLGK
jgi:N-acetylmuramoyl-L-alanine amidase